MRKGRHVIWRAIAFKSRYHDISMISQDIYYYHDILISLQNDFFVS